MAASWNVAPTNPLPVVRDDAKTGEPSLDLMRWGLVPFWAKISKSVSRTSTPKPRGSKVSRRSARRSSAAGGRPAIRGDQCRACGRCCGARGVGTVPGRLARPCLRGCAKQRSSRPVIALPTTVMDPTGHRHDEIARSQVHHRRRPDRPHPNECLGQSSGGEDAAIDALVETVRNMTGKDFAAEARTLERLGLSGMDGPQIRRVMDEGFS